MSLGLSHPNKLTELRLELQLRKNKAASEPLAKTNATLELTGLSLTSRTPATGPIASTTSESTSIHDEFLACLPSELKDVRFVGLGTLLHCMRCTVLIRNNVLRQV